MSHDIYQEELQQQQYELIEIADDECDENGTITDFDSRMVKIVYSSDDDTDDENESEQSAAANNKSLTCCYCDFTTPVKYKFGEHMQNNHGFSIKPFEFHCRECRKQFSSWTNYRRHNSNVHKKKNRDYQCAFCDFNSKSRTSVRKHMGEHVETAYHPCKSKELGYKCRYCHQMFWTVMKLNDHTLNWHAENCSADFLLCNFCLATFTNKTSLRLHYSFQHPILLQFRSYLFECKICRIGFATLDRIRAHMFDNHPAYKSIYCDREQCRFNAINEDNLKAHVSLFHKRKIFRCVECSREFKTKLNAMKHAELKHNDSWKTSKTEQ